MDKKTLQAELGKLYFEKEKITQKISAIKTLLNLDESNITLNITTEKKKPQKENRRDDFAVQPKEPPTASLQSPRSTAKRSANSNQKEDTKQVIATVLKKAGQPMQSKNLFAAYQAAGGTKPLLTFNTYMSRYSKDATSGIKKVGRGVYGA
jgi:hypothetical protein